MTDSAPPPSAADANPKRRRRRRRGGTGPRRDGGSSGPPPKGPERAPERALERQSLLTAHDGPLSPDELAQCSRWLRFIARHKEVLRVRWSAQEDLLINGAREPERRGVMQHLLRKIDAATLRKAHDRVSDARRWAEILAGVVEWSDDLEILLMWLEGLTEASSRRAAAGAFSLATGHMDFGELSDARFQRVLAVLTATFSGHELMQVLFGLMHSAEFRAGFEQVGDSLPPELRGELLPLEAAYEAIVLGEPSRHGRGMEVRGARLLLAAPAETLAAYPEPVRVRLLERAVGLMADREEADRAAATLLETIDPRSPDALRLGRARAGELLRTGQDARAKWLIGRLRSAHGSDPELQLWGKALGAARVGRFALGKAPDLLPRTGPTAPKGGPRGGPRSGLQPAWWIDEQRSVWLLLGDPGQDLAVTRDTLSMGLLGMVPLLGSGHDDGRPWIAFAPVGRRLSDARLATATAIGLALAGLRLLRTLAACGLTLPDARVERFLYLPGPWPALLLFDARGAARSPAEETDKRVSGATFGLARQLLQGCPDLPERLDRVLRRRSSRPAQLERELVLALPDAPIRG